jgi:hypothetical protein
MWNVKGWGVRKPECFDCRMIVPCAKGMAHGVMTEERNQLYQHNQLNKLKST